MTASDRDCAHGQLVRSCDRCADAREIAELRAEVARLKEHAVVLANSERLAERERCAKVCDDLSDEYQRTEGRRYPELKSDAQEGAAACASAIRAGA